MKTNHIARDVSANSDIPVGDLLVDHISQELTTLLIREGILSSKDTEEAQLRARTLLDSTGLNPLKTHPHSSTESGQNPLHLLLSLASRIETALDPEVRRKEGIVYTPPFIAERILQSGLTSRQRDERTTILDPACGSGVFLLVAFFILTTRGCDPETALTSLYGVDKDPFAIQISSLLLKTAFLLVTRSQSPAPSVHDNLIAGDTLFGTGEWEEKLKIATFDLVVGNPPYGIARDDKLTPLENEELKARYQSVRVGKIDKYIAFMAKRYSLLGDKGFLSYVVPNAWLGIRSGQKIREKFLQEKALTKIVVLPQSVFEGRALEVVIFEVWKGTNSRSYTVENLEGRTVATIPYSAIETSPGQSIPTAWSSALTNLFSYIKTKSTPLSQEGTFLPLIALQAYAMGKGTPPQTQEIVSSHAFHAKTAIDPTYLPYLRGQDVERYRVKWSGEYLSYGRWLAEHHDLKRYTQPRILLREILGKAPYTIIATALDGIYLYNRSVLHILSNGEDAMARAEALALILNSKLATVILGFTGRKTQRTLFPKLVNDDLISFPLPQLFNSMVPILSERYRSVRSYVTPQIEADRLVYQCYELDDSLIAAVEEALTILPSR